MTEPLLQVRDLEKRFVVRRSLLGRPLAEVRAVDGVSFDIRAGETLALVGESGCGKSTVGRLILALTEASAGTVRFDGQDIGTLRAQDLRALRAKAQLIFQDPYASLNPRMTVFATLAEPLRLHTQLNAADRRDRIAELLETVGLRPEAAQRYPHQFSGGQRQRIAIARALAPGPKLIVCDEPVSALDVSVRAQVLNLLRDLQQKFGLAYLFISHDLSVVKHIADRVAVMYLGRIVETGQTDPLFADPRHPYTRALLSAIPLPVPIKRPARVLLPGDPPSPISPPPGCHLHPRCAHATSVCTAERPPLQADAGGHATACHLWPTLGSGAGTVPADGVRNRSLEKLILAFQADGMIAVEQPGDVS
jgi:oligopeptide/dipeptide ABC transporter ATP-binding protein